jgi:hypothetical protein
MNTTELGHYCLATEARDSLTNLFPTSNSFAWFVRQNRTDLARSGALLKVAGRQVFHREKLSRFIVDHGIKSALNEVAK